MQSLTKFLKKDINDKDFPIKYQLMLKSEFPLELYFMCLLGVI
jgi:hypothetical protein